MEADMKDGMVHSSAIHLKDNKEEKEENCEEPARKKAKTSSNQCTSVTRKKEAARCKCGGGDHKRITSSKKCPWKGLSTKIVCKIMSRGSK
jgi:hypothetical protein